MFPFPISGDRLDPGIKPASQVALVVKNPPAKAGDVGDTGLRPGLGRSRGGGHSNPLQAKSDMTETI